jgi:hypothetical protein
MATLLRPVVAMGRRFDIEGFCRPRGVVREDVE